MEEQIVGLETRVAYFENLTDELNRTVYRQQQQIDRLALEINMMKEKINSVSGSLVGNIGDEAPPPHY